MSTTVDNFVAEARFDNRQFEENVYKSITSVNELKQSLNFDGAAKGLTELDKAASNVSFDNMSKSLSVLEKRFSTVGIIGMRVIQNLTDSAMKLVGRTLTSIPNRIIEGGKSRAFNIENARFMLQGMMNDGKQVEAVMDDAKNSVMDTAYGYGDAAKAAAQFAVTGIQAGEQMQTALKGVAGVSATLNASYEDISRIFTQVAGQSRLMSNDLIQLSNKGLNAAATLSEYFNKVQSGSLNASASVKSAIQELTNGLDVTEADIRNFITKGKISFDIFAEAMGTTFGDHAKDANKTINGVTDNIQAAFSKIGAKFIAPLIEQENPIVKMLGTVKDKINDINNSIDPLAETFSGTILKLAGYVDELLQKIDVTGVFNKLGEAVRKFNNFWLGKSVITKDDFMGLKLAGSRLSVFRKLLTSVAKEHGINIDKIIKKNGNFADSLKTGWLTKDIFTEALNKLKSLDGSVDSTSVNAVKRFDAIREAAKKTIRGDYGNGIKRIEKLNKEGFDSKTVQKYVNTIHKLTKGTWDYNDAVLDAAESQLDLGQAIDEMSDSELKTLGFTKKEIKALRELQKTAKETGTPLNDLVAAFEKPGFFESVLISIKNVGGGIVGVLNSIKKAAANVFNTNIKGALQSVGAALLSVTSRFRLSADVTGKLQKAFEGFFTIIKTVGSAAIVILKKISPVIDMVAGGVLNLASFLGEFIVNITESAKNSEGLHKIISTLGGAINVVSGFVGGIINRIHNWIQESNIATVAIEALQNAVKTVTEKIQEFFSREDVQQKLEQIKNSVKTFGEEVLQTIDKISEKIKSPKDILDSISQKFSGLTGFKTVIENFLGWIRNTVEQIKASVSKSPKEIFEILSSNVLSGFTQFKSDLDAAIKSANVIDVLKDKFNSIVEMIANFKNQLGGGGIATSEANLFGEWVPKIGEFLKKLSEVFSNVNWGGLISVAAGLGTIMSIKKAFDSLQEVVKMIGNLSNNITGVIKDSLNLINKFVQDTFGVLFKAYAEAERAKAFKNKAKGFLILTAGIAVIAAAIYFLGKMEKDELIKGGAAVGIIAAVMVGIIALTSFISKKFGDSMISGRSMLSMGLGLLLFVASLKLILKVLKDIENYNIENIKKMLSNLAIVVGTLIGVSFAMSKLNFSGGLGLIATVLSLKLFIGVVNDIAKMDLNAIQKNIGAFVAVFSMLALVMVLSHFAGKNALKAGVMFLGIGLAIKMIVSAMETLGNMDPKQAAQGLTGVMKILLLFSAMMVISLALGKNSAKAGVMFFGIAAAMMAMALAIKILGSMKPAHAQRGVAIVTQLLIMFSVVMLASHFVGGAYKTIMMMAMTIAILTICVGALSMLDAESLKRTTACLTLLMLAFAAMEVAFGQIAYVPIARTLPNILMMVGALAAIAAVLVILDRMNLQSSLENAKALSLVMVSLTACLAILTKAGVGLKSSAYAGGGLAIFVGIVGALGLVIGAINDFLSKNGIDIVSMINNAIPVFNSIGELFGSLIGGVLKGIAPNAGDALISFGENLSSFGSSIGPFFETISGLDMENVSKIGTLANALLQLTASNLLDGIASWLRGAGDIPSFAQSLTDLAGGLVDFSQKVKEGEFDSDAVDKSMNLASMLAAFASHEIPKTGGLLQLIVGESKLGEFAKSLPSLAMGLGFFALIVKAFPFDDDAVGRATNLASMLAALASNEIPTSGGLAEVIFGSRSLGKFAENLPLLGNGLQGFVAQINGVTFDENKVAIVEKMMGALSALSNADINATGGLGGLIFGGDDLKSLGNALPNLATGLKKFSDKLNEAENLDSPNMDKAIDLMTSISQLPNTENVNVDKLKTAIMDLGDALSNYSSQVTAIDFDGQMTKSLTFIDKLKAKMKGGVDDSGLNKVMETLGGIGGKIKESFTGAAGDVSSEVSSTADSITSSFSSALSNGFKNISVDVDPIIQSIIGAINDKLGDLKSAGESVGTNIAEGLSSVADSLSEALTTAIDGAKKAADGKAKDFLSVGKSIVSNIMKSLLILPVTLIHVFSSAFSAAIGRIRSYYNDFHASGSYAAQGLVNGLRSKIPSVVAAGDELAKASQNAVKKANNQGSPSKEFYKIGAFAGQGYVNALKDYCDVAYKAGTSLSKASRDGLSKAVSKVTDLIQNGVDNELTIRPVVDLTNVKASAGQIGDILAGPGYTINNPYHINAAAAIVNSRNQLTNNDVVNAIRTLDRNIGKLAPGDTYNVNGITYDDGSNISDAIGVLIRAARMERRA